MHTLKEQINEIFDDTGEHLFEELAQPTRWWLTAAFILEDDSDIGEVLLRMPDEYRALSFSQMAGPENCDLHDFRNTFRMIACVYYATQIQAEMDHEWRSFLRYRAMDTAEHQADALRESA